MLQKFHTIKANTFDEIRSLRNDLTLKELVLLAADNLQSYLSQANEINHDFKFNQSYEGTVSGKMFGVLVCENEQKEIGFLAGFSGKLGNENHYPYFVPPVFDILESESFFMKEIQIINAINQEIRFIENNLFFQEKLKQLEHQIQQTENEIKNQRTTLKTAKIQRQQERIKFQNELEQLEQLDKESELENVQFKKNRKALEKKIEDFNIDLEQFKKPLELLKADRSQRSHELQMKIFERFTFLNAKGVSKNLEELFNQNLGIQPPAGAGECAAPKLIHYAFQNNLKPLALAEFWWGQSPKSITRKHGEFYPYCKEKCEPILNYMLDGVAMEFVG